jgi:hypothetical protein
MRDRKRLAIAVVLVGLVMTVAPRGGTVVARGDAYCLPTAETPIGNTCVLVG